MLRTNGMLLMPILGVDVPPTDSFSHWFQWDLLKTKTTVSIDELVYLLVQTV